MCSDGVSLRIDIDTYTEKGEPYQLRAEYRLAHYFGIVSSELVLNNEI